MSYDIYYTEGKFAGQLKEAGISLQQAMMVTNLEEDEVRYAIETFGSCEALVNFETGECVVVVPTGKPYPGPNREAKK